MLSRAHMCSLWRVVAFLAVGSLFAVGVTTPASAQTEDEPPSLAGETLQYMPFEPTGPQNRVEITAECDPEGTSTVRFEAAGVAAGPYPGTFEASGTATIGPHIPEFVGFETAGVLITFEETFRIYSPVGDVTGTKTLSALVPGIGTCFSATGLDEPPFFDQSGYQYAVYANTTYEATVQTSSGRFHESGTSRVDVSEVRHCYHFEDPDAPEVCGFGRNFNETFLESTPDDETTAIVVLDPVTAVNPVDTRHTVTATATTATGEPTEGVRIEFTIVGVSSEEQGATIERSCRTNQDGQCDITYEGPTFPGVDVITACADSDEDGERDADEPCGEATKEWVLPGSTPGKTTGGGQILHINSTGTTFGFTFESDGVSDDSIRGECLVLDHAPADDKVDCLNVLAYVQSANEATIYGNATLNGEDAGLFRMHVVDNGESGIGQDVFEFETQHGYVRTGVLTEGDIQVHQ